MKDLEKLICGFISHQVQCCKVVFTPNTRKIFCFSLLGQIWPLGWFGRIWNTQIFALNSQQESGNSNDCHFHHRQRMRLLILDHLPVVEVPAMVKSHLLLGFIPGQSQSWVIKLWTPTDSIDKLYFSSSVTAVIPFDANFCAQVKTCSTFYLHHPAQTCIYSQPLASLLSLIM